MKGEHTESIHEGFYRFGEYSTHLVKVVHRTHRGLIG